MNIKNLINIITKELSYKEAYSHMLFLVEEVGERLAGTDQLLKASRYIHNKMSKFRLNSRIDEFHMYSSLPILSELETLTPQQLVIESFPNLHSPSTLPEGIEGELVYVGAGGEQDYKNKNAKGKIVLAELSYSPPRPEKIKIAEKNHAKAVILMNWGPVEKKVIGRGAIKWVWGNPTPEEWELMPKIPSINISRAAGEYLKNLLENSKVKVRIRLENIRKWVKARQPTAELKGKIEPDKFILIGGHLEAWGKTATCNSCGNALMLELARVLAKHRDKLRRSLIFVFWDGHEIAEAAGSTWHVDYYWQKLNKNCIAYINIDSPGLKGASRYVAKAALETWDLLEQIGKEIGIKIEKSPPTKTGDNSFLGIGIPYIGVFATYTPEELREKLNWATLGWWYHSNEDTLDKIDKELFIQHAELYTHLIIRLCNEPIIPLNFITTVNYIINELKELSKIAKNKINLTSIQAEAETLLKITKKLNETIAEIKERYQKSTETYQDKINIINKCLIKLSRILTPAFRSVAGRYGQDPYGYTPLQKPIPRLYYIVKKLTQLSEKESLHHQLKTKFLRERNKLVDASTNAQQTIQTTLKLLNHY